jgi:hypothetical protein
LILRRGDMSLKRDKVEQWNPVREAARTFKGSRYCLTRVRPGSKGPYEKGWQNRDPGPEDFQTEDNIGVQLGAKSGGLVDLDFDSSESRALADLSCFFGGAPSFGREILCGSGLGHRLLICRDAPDKAKKFDLTKAAEKEVVASLRLAKNTILEVRGGRCQTVVPPSKIDDDRIIWGPGDRTPPSMDWETLHQKAALLTVVSLLAAAYPPEGGRDIFCLHLAGALVHWGVEVEVAEEIVAAIARLKGDTENRPGSRAPRRTKSLRASPSPVCPPCWRSSA